MHKPGVEADVRKAIYLLVAIPVFAQTQPAPTFEAATIKPTAQAMGSSGWDTHPGTLIIRGKTLQGLIAIAYGLKDDQISGGPKWLDGDRFDVNAKGAGAEDDRHLLAMLQTLLADRFQLTTHRGEKLVSGYALVQLKAGLKIKPGVPGPDNSLNTVNGHMTAHGTSMSRLAETLSRIAKNPVFDLTGAAGVFDFQLQWSTDGDPTEVISSLSDALQDQLGLKLELRKVPVDMVVVDKAEKPSEN